MTKLAAIITEIEGPLQFRKITSRERTGSKKKISVALDSTRESADGYIALLLLRRIDRSSITRVNVSPFPRDSQLFNKDRNYDGRALRRPISSQIFRTKINFGIRLDCLGSYRALFTFTSGTVVTSNIRNLPVFRSRFTGAIFAENSGFS